MKKLTPKQWNIYGNTMLSPIERVKDEIRGSIQLVREVGPTWEETNDARWSWFTGAKKLLQTTQLGGIYIRDSLSDEAWWRKRVQEFSPDEISEYIKEFVVFQTYGLSNALFTVTEESMRLILRSIDPEACNKARGNFKSIYDLLLKRIGGEHHTDLFDFHRLIRNTIHTNGVFRPYNGKGRAIVFDGEEFHFRDGQKVDFVNLALVLRITTRLNKAMYQIVTSEPIVTIETIDRFR